MGWLAERFISNCNVSYLASDNAVEHATEKEISKSQKEWADRRMKDRLYPILDKLRYGYLKLEEVNENNFKNFHGVFVREEYDWFILNYKRNNV
jgi:alpha-amylase/alpha-mannosidase (GH57 family)